MFSLLILILIVSSASCGHWGYEGAGSDWSKEAKECRVGRLQSPIDINTKSVIYDRKLNVNFNNFDKPIDGEHLRLENNGHTVQVTLDRDAVRGRVPYVNGSAVGNDNYEFVQLHFHWDEEDDMGSEHAIDGIRYALEVSDGCFLMNHKLITTPHRCTMFWLTRNTELMCPKQRGIRMD